jgi:hypothetical protein
MQKRGLVLTTRAFILAGGIIAASAQQEPMAQQQPQVLQQREQERQPQGAQIPRRVVEDDIGDDGWMTAGTMGRVGGIVWTGVEGWA